MVDRKLNQNDIQTPQNTTSDGKFKIVTDIPSNPADTSVGIYVKGVADSSIRVGSQSSPKYELVRKDLSDTTTIQSAIGIDAGNTFFINYQNNTVGNASPITPIQITNNGMFFQNSMISEEE